jgi:cell wall-associated NlpC family hydrolase
VHRSILAGFFVFTLSSGVFGIAAADEPSPANPRLPVTATSAVPDSTDSGDAAAPTAGADLAMWNAGPAAPSDSVAPEKPMGRLRRFASGIMSRSSAIASSLTRSAMRFIGVPYVFGGTHPSGFDCSGYVQHVYGMNGVRLPRTADAQFDAGRKISAKIVPGDLVFFHTYAPGVSHVGIYLGNSKFIHASASRGVAVSSLHDRYWAPRYVGAKRVVGT